MNNIDISTESTKFVFVGLDVHKATISACVLDTDTGQILLERQLKNSFESLKKFIKLVRRRAGEPRCCYEASCCGFVLYHELARLSVNCEVIAPSSIPRRSGDRVKNDRIDAKKLACFYRAGLLKGIDIPDQEQEATRALIRCRQALIDDLYRTKKRVTSLLLNRGLAFTEGTNWSQRFWLWINRIAREKRLDERDQMVLDTYTHQIEYIKAQIATLEVRIEKEAQAPRYRETVRKLGAFRGIATLSALTIAAELGDIRRFASPRQLMAYLGLVPGERSSGESTIRCSITKAGNVHARKAIVSAAWKYAARPTRGHPLKKRQALLDTREAPRILATSWKAQQRLYKRFHALAYKKPRSVAAVAVARELTGFLWAALQPADSIEQAC